VKSDGMTPSKEVLEADLELAGGRYACQAVVEEPCSAGASALFEVGPADRLSRAGTMQGAAKAGNEIESSSPLGFWFSLCTAVFTLLLLTLALLNGWLGEAVGVGSGFGEASRPGLIKQPANFWSSLGFVVAGLLIGWQLRRAAGEPEASPFARNTFYSSLFASLVVCLGSGSMAMHASESRLGGHLDLLSMYLAGAFTLAYAVTRLLRLSWTWFSILFGAVLALCLAAQNLPYEVPIVRNCGEFIFAFCLVLALVFEILNLFVRKLNHDGRWGSAGLGLLLAAFGVWKLALSRPPSHSLLQGHAAWHLLCALAAYCVLRYYASEKPRSSPAAASRLPTSTDAVCFQQHE
jgi:hypothetical protein